MDNEKIQKLIQNASKIARQNFKFLWREQFWNLRRKKKNCSYVAFLCTVSDEINGEKVQEKFWLSDVMCDGQYAYGTVTTAPSIIQHIDKGSICTVPIDRIEDWMYVIDNKVYGGYTLNVRRSVLRGNELTMFDKGWGFQFGNPLYTDKYPVKRKPPKAAESEEDEKPPTKFFGITLQKKAKTKVTEDEENQESEEPEINRELDHPDAIARQVNYEQIYRNHPEKVNEVDANGWTPLHNHALAGNRHIVNILLECGADPTVETSHGHTALQLAQIMGWMEVVKRLSLF